MTVSPERTTSAPLRAELEALNLELRELKSTDYSVRAYIETWIAAATGGAACKLIYDWQRMHSKPPIVAFPLAFFALAVLTDSIVQRVKGHRLAVVENRKLARQRELRQLLGIDEANVPHMAPLDIQPSPT
jgi:hypothetical protein